jgi:hypothetical protein
VVKIPISRYHLLDSSHAAFFFEEEGKIRRISPNVLRAQELLGHAIDHIADDLVNEGYIFSKDHPRASAIQILLSLSRLIHLECPESREQGEPAEP